MTHEYHSETGSQSSFARESAYRRFLPIHQKALIVAKNLERCEFEMIEILQLADFDGGYRALRFKSLFQYATVALKLSEDRAYIFITVARKAANLTLMQEALRKGELKVSKAKKLSSVISKDNEEHWLRLAKNMSQRSLEREISKTNPRSKVEEGSKFISEDILEFRAAIDLETEAEIKRVQDLLSQSLGRPATYNEILKAMAKEYCKAKDPVIKAERILKKKMKTQKPKFQGTKSSETKTQTDADAKFYSSHAQFKRQPISKELKHRVFARDQGQCQERYEAGICGESRWIDVHHIKPVSLGGQNILENLVTLCRAHHRMEHFG